MKRILLTLAMCIISLHTFASSKLEKSARIKIATLERLINEAKADGIEVSREECVVWMSELFLTYANWDEEHEELNNHHFSVWPTFSDNAKKMAKELPDYERSEVNEMLDSSIEVLERIIAGEYVRRAVPQIDWESITLDNDQFISNGQPIFINDYFTKEPGFENDYLGKLSRASLSLAVLNGADGSISQTGENLIDKDDNYSGYTLLWHGGAPAWANSIHDDLSVGKRLFTAYDIDNPNIRDMWRQAFKLTVPHMKDKSYTDLGYILANEPHWFTLENTWATGEVSQYTKAKFREWLRIKHKDIAELNELWNSNYASFDDVDIEIPYKKELEGSPMLYDWKRFNMCRATDWFVFLDGEIKRYDSSAKSHIKIMPHLFTEDRRDHGIDLEALVETTDIIGNDAKICRKQTRMPDKEYWEDIYSYDWKEMAMSYDFCKSVAPNNTNINSESHLLSSSRYRDPYMTTDFTRSVYWMSVLHGLNISLTWFWPRGVDGKVRPDLMNYNGPDEAMIRSYAACVVQQPRVANEVSQTMMDINAYGEEFAEFQRLKRPIRIFHSETSAINKTHHMEELFKLYQRLYFEGTPLGFATQNIINKQDCGNWEVLLVRKTEYVTDSEFAALQSYLNLGGVIIIDEESLTMNEYGQRRKSGLKQSNGKIIKAGSVDDFATSALSEVADKLPLIKIEESNELGAKGCFWRVIERGDGVSILTIVNLGKGDAKLNILGVDKEIESLTNLFTGEVMEDNISITPDKVMLIEIKK